METLPLTTARILLKHMSDAGGPVSALELPELRLGVWLVFLGSRSSTLLLISQPH